MCVCDLGWESADKTDVLNNPTGQHTHTISTCPDECCFSPFRAVTWCLREDTALVQTNTHHVREESIEYVWHELGI